MNIRRFLPVIIGLGLVLIIGLWFINVKNGAIEVDQAVKKEWGNVQTTYQKRTDLIPNLVETVKGYAKHESTTLIAVVEARAKATSINIDPANVTPEQLAAFNKAQSGVSSTLSRLLVSVEQYPDLKANQNFIDFQRELTSIENQILTARTRYNESVEKYNNYVLKMPRNMILSEYKEKAAFEAVEGADKPVDVKF